MTPDLASRFAQIALGHTTREFPHKLDHVWNDATDGTRPRDQHPIFHGSFDWHSCVHGYWLLLRLLRRFPDLAEAPAIAARVDTMFTTSNVAGELAYLGRTNAGGFERPYGWAWLLALHAEAARHHRDWAVTLEPLAAAFAERFHAFLPKQTYPIRTDAHGNSAFALILAQHWATTFDPVLADLIVTRARRWFGEDRAAQAWEPDGDAFLSATLCEALLMQRVLPRGEFAAWFADFLPAREARQPAALFAPATVSDRSDGKIAHLDGFNLSRAWAWRALGEGGVADNLLDASLPHIAEDYAGEHWLATFALLAVDGL
jgi:hypothetical protein